MLKIIGKSLKATVINIIVALLIVIILMFSVNILIGQQKDLLITLINTISVKKEEKIEANTIIHENKLKNYPEIGRAHV